MPTVTVEARDFAATLRQHFRARAKALVAATHEVAHRGLAEAVRITDAEGLVDSGAYKRAFRVADGGGSGRLTNAGFRDMRFRLVPAELRNDAPHAAVIEWGRRPGRPGPPLEPIRAWVQRKLGKTGPELEAAARAIRDHLHRYGSRPRGVMRRVYEQMGPWYKAEVERRLRAGR